MLNLQDNDACGCIQFYFQKLLSASNVSGVLIYVGTLYSSTRLVLISSSYDRN